MEGNHNTDDSSHYEISLTAAQAFIAFVLLLFSLAAAFAFGVIVGKGQFDDLLAASYEAKRPLSQEANIADLASERGSEQEEAATPANPPVIVEEPPPPMGSGTARVPVLEPAGAAEPTPHFAQLLSTSDATAAESLAAKLIEAGFGTAYVERISSPRGMIHRVRVRFPSETDARHAVERLKQFASGEIWIARQ